MYHESIHDAGEFYRLVYLIFVVSYFCTNKWKTQKSIINVYSNVLIRSWSGFNDELAWGALWLAKATGKKEYLKKAKGFYDEFNLGKYADQFGWDDKKPGVMVKLYILFHHVIIIRIFNDQIE